MSFVSSSGAPQWWCSWTITKKNKMLKGKRRGNLGADEHQNLAGNRPNHPRYPHTRPFQAAPDDRYLSSSVHFLITLSTQRNCDRKTGRFNNGEVSRSWYRPGKPEMGASEITPSSVEKAAQSGYLASQRKTLRRQGGERQSDPPVGYFWSAISRNLSMAQRVLSSTFPDFLSLSLGRSFCGGSSRPLGTWAQQHRVSLVPRGTLQIRIWFVRQRGNRGKPRYPLLL